MRKRSSLYALVLCLVLSSFALTLGVQVSEAKNPSEGAQVFTRPPQGSGSPGSWQDFVEQGANSAESCSGACDDEVCVCYGSYDCCSLGCELCWIILDNS